MWFRKASPRRQAIREDVAESESLAPAPRSHRGQVVIIAGVFFLVASLVQFWPQPLVPYYIGQKAPVEIRSPVAFSMENRAATEAKREFARTTTPPVLVADPTALDYIGTELIGIAASISNRTINNVPRDVAAKLPGLTAEALQQLQKHDAVSIRTFIASVFREVPFVSRADFDAMQLRKPKPTRVAVLRPRETISENVPEPLIENVVVVGNLTSEQRARIQSEATKLLGADLGNVITSYLVAHVTRPTYTYDPRQTSQLAELRAQNQATVAEITVAENEIIVRAGEIIDRPILEKLIEAQRQLENKQALVSNAPWAPWSKLLTGVGKVLTVALLTIIGVIYILRMNSRAAKTPRQGWAVCLLLLGALILARAFVGNWPQLAYLAGIAPTLFATIILVITYNQRFALGIAGLHGLLVVTTLGLGLDFYLALLAGACVYCFGLAEIRTRSKLIEIGFVAATAIFAAVWALGLTRLIGSVWNPALIPTAIPVLLEQSLWGAAGALVADIVIVFALPYVERVFRISTAMALLELCDANKPLLRRLQQESPGTFNHSLTVGIMAEAAGNAIGANGLLCRVGAYYHDVGKLSKPQYFIENQSGGAPNRHEKLSPAMSLLIIVGHVKDGIELAREYGLPSVVIPFIAQHHGTTLVEYFYHAARKRQENQGEEAPSETEFRYPGPKPQTREAAIVMICDSCESVVRSIEEPTPGRIEAAVHAMINKRLMDGQFNQCDLTLRDLSTLEQTLTRTLVAIHHGRIPYPSNRVTPPAPLPQSA